MHWFHFLCTHYSTNYPTSSCLVSVPLLHNFRSQLLIQSLAVKLIWSETCKKPANAWMISRMNLAHLFLWCLWSKDLPVWRISRLSLVQVIWNVRYGCAGQNNEGNVPFSQGTCTISSTQQEMWWARTRVSASTSLLTPKYCSTLLLHPSPQHRIVKLKDPSSLRLLNNLTLSSNPFVLQLQQMVSSS